MGEGFSSSCPLNGRVISTNVLGYKLHHLSDLLNLYNICTNALRNFGVVDPALKFITISSP